MRSPQSLCINALVRGLTRGYVSLLGNCSAHLSQHQLVFITSEWFEGKPKSSGSNCLSNRDAPKALLRSGLRPYLPSGGGYPQQYYNRHGMQNMSLQPLSKQIYLRRFRQRCKVSHEPHLLDRRHQDSRRYVSFHGLSNTGRASLMDFDRPEHGCVRTIPAMSTSTI